jgi:hypothetical protein
MPVFDHVRGYQFGFFFRAQGPMDGARAAEVLAAPIQGGPALSVRFNRLSPVSQLVSPGDGQTHLIQVLSYSGPPGWRAELSGSRVDVHVDAQGYHEVTGVELPLNEVRRRIVPNFALLAGEMNLSISRLVLAVNLEAIDEQNEGLPQLASHMFSDAIKEQVRRAECVELAGRQNLATRWTLGDRQVGVNRIEGAEALVTYDMALGGSVRSRRVLKWSLDVNTSPAEELAATGVEVKTFFEEAVRWIDERVNTLEAR